MRALTELAFADEAEPHLRRIFCGDEPYADSYANGVDAKLILFEYWYELEPPLLDALAQTATRLGEQGFYVSILDRPLQAEQRQSYHWYVPWNEVSRYQGLVGPLQNVVYSDQGNWAIMGSDEHHGLLGCRMDVYSELVATIPDLEQQVDQFVYFWQQQPVASHTWLVPLLQAVYGRRALAILQRTQAHQPS